MSEYLKRIGFITFANATLVYDCFFHMIMNQNIALSRELVYQRTIRPYTTVLVDANF